MYIVAVYNAFVWLNPCKDSANTALIVDMENVYTLRITCFKKPHRHRHFPIMLFAASASNFPRW